jgi:hypothetical protein
VLLRRGPRRGPGRRLKASSVATQYVERSVPRAPIYTQYNTPKIYQPFDFPNLLLTTLAVTVAATAPFSQEDWPSANRQPLAGQSFTQGTPLPLLVAPVTASAGCARRC